MVVVDLDGTYVSCNTLHLYLRTALRYHIRKGHIGSAARIVFHYLRRGARLCGHTAFKTAALAAAGRDDSLLKEFRNKAERLVNNRLKESLADETEPVVMATAAPAFYACLIWPGRLLASQWLADGTFDELRGQNKLRAVQTILGQGETISRVYTDHYDDLPLMRAAKVVVLVGPSKKTLHTLAEAGVGFHTF